MNRDDFDAFKARAAAILQRCEAREYTYGEGKMQTQSRLYLCDEAVRDALLALRREAEAAYDAPSQKKRYPLSKLFKLINPEGVAHHFSVNKERRFRHLASPKRVAAALEREVAVWAAKERKRIKERYEPGAERSAALERFEADAQRAREEVAEVLRAYVPPENEEDDGAFEGYEVRIISKQNAKEYASLHYYLEGEKRQRHAHLSIEAPNVLVYRSRRREDEKVEGFMRRATERFGDIFIVKK